MTQHLLGSVSLPGDLVWTDEFTWPTVVRASEYALNGALIVDSARRLAGRPITLAGAVDCWVTRATVAALRNLACELPGQWVLALADGRSFNVTFSPDDPIAAEPLYPIADPSEDFPYIVTIKMIEV